MFRKISIIFILTLVAVASYAQEEMRNAVSKDGSVMSKKVKREIWRIPDKSLKATILTEGFEGAWLPAGWTVIQTNTDNSALIPGWWSKTSYDCHTGTYSAGLWWSYEHQDESLITPDIELTGSAGGVYYGSFWTYGWEGSIYGDHYYVKVSTDGGVTWTVLLDLSDLTGNDWNYWDYPYVLDLSSYASQTIRLAWHAEDPPSNDGLWSMWLIDDVEVGYPLDHDVGVTGIYSPMGSYVPDVSVTPSIEVENFGANNETFDVTFKIFNGGEGEVYSETQNVTVNQGASQTVDFLSFTTALGSYTTLTYTQLGTDEEPANDSLVGSSSVSELEGWFLQNPLPTPEPLRSVYFTDANTGWAVGHSWVLGSPGVIVHTTDGGASWSTQSSQTTEWVKSVYFVDANTGWAVGRSGTILHTTNGGSNWTAQSSGTLKDLKSVYFTDANTGWAVGYVGRIVHTTDGGSNWSAQSSGPTYPDFNSVYFIDANTGWAVGEDGAIKHTSNGGVSWATQFSGTLKDLESVYFTDANTGWAVGSCGTILLTTNGGTNWNTQSITYKALKSVYFTDANRGWTVGRDGTIIHTTDGGENWSAQSSGTTSWLEGVCFTDANTGWAVGSHGIILHTTNGGSNWSAQSSGTTMWLKSVYFTDANTGWAVGYVGTIVHTTDGGSNWAIQSSATTEDLYSVYFTDANRGWTVGVDGTILHTTDGGENWSAQSSGTSIALASVYFTDPNNGWAVGDDGIILHTTNGGSNWDPQTSGTYYNFSSVYFTDANKGWVVGEYGEIRHTTDGGENWSAQTSGTIHDLEGVYFTDANKGWAVGEYGTILHTTTGGATGVAEDDDNRPSRLPENFSLSQNYPNPFNSQTVIQYSLPEAGRVTIKVYNILGQEVQVLVDRFQPSGIHQIIWDGEGKSDQSCASGIYLYRLTMQGSNHRSSETKKMVLVK